MYHEVTMIGNLVHDPSMRYTPTGTAVTNFTVATSNKISKERTPECPDGWKEGYKGKNWEQTIFWRVTAWRKTAEIANQYLSKGSQVFIKGNINGVTESGVLNPRTWTGNDGVVRASFEITARLIKFMRGGKQAQQQEDEAPPDYVEENEIPF